MSKELTDAYRSKKLKKGWYWVKFNCFANIYPSFYEKGYFWDDGKVEDVISPCDYEDMAHLETKNEWQAERIKELEKKLKIAVKALKEYANRKKWKDIELYEMYYFAAQFKSRGYEIAEKALNEFN